MSEPQNPEPTILILCPLHVERKAVTRCLSEFIKRETIGDTKYFHGLIGTSRVVVVEFSYQKTGPIWATRYACNALTQFPSLSKPTSYRLLVGIAGGIGDVKIGDVVIATSIWEWKAGKEINGKLIPTNHPQRIVRQLDDVLASIACNRDAFARKMASEAADVLPLEDRTDNAPEIHDGLIASGSVLLKDAAQHPTLIERQVLAVEMEACGVMTEDFIVVRGISDKADQDKNDVWQKYAATNAATCAKLLLLCLDRILGQQSNSGTASRRGVASSVTSITSVLSQHRPGATHVSSAPVVPKAVRFSDNIDVLPRHPYSSSSSGVDRSRVQSQPDKHGGRSQQVSSRNSKIPSCDETDDDDNSEYGSDEFSEGDGLRRVVIPGTGIEPESLALYLKLLDPEARVQRQFHPETGDRRYIVTTRKRVYSEDVQAIKDDSRAWRVEGLGPYIDSETAQRRMSHGVRSNRRPTADIVEDRHYKQPNRQVNIPRRASSRGVSDSFGGRGDRYEPHHPRSAKSAGLSLALGLAKSAVDMRSYIKALPKK